MMPFPKTLENGNTSFSSITLKSKIPSLEKPRSATQNILAQLPTQWSYRQDANSKMEPEEKSNMSEKSLTSGSAISLEFV